MPTPIRSFALDDLVFEPSPFLSALPPDPDTRVVPRVAPAAGYSWVSPAPVAAPALLAWSSPFAAELGLPEEPSDHNALARLFSGNSLPPGTRPYASCYGGHQFGQWAGQLGDGRAINLGVLRDRAGSLQEVQLKGAGRTPYSRHADGRAVLRSSLREYLCSEAMHHLGVPTTRALCLVATGEDVVRDMFYDRRPRAEPGAIVTRVAPSFLRFGHYELLAARGQADLLRQLLDFTVRTCSPALGAPSQETYIAWFAELCQRTARLMAEWLRVGFVHGVMNTDNLSILGLTIDYGPYGWLDGFDPTFTPNTTDTGGRYSFGNQAQIAAWNLGCLAQALLPVVNDQRALEDALDLYRASFEAAYLAVLQDKLGLARDGDVAAHFRLINGLIDCFSSVETDMTIFYRKLGALAASPVPAENALEVIADAFYTRASTRAQERWLAWLQAWQAETAGVDPTRAARMNAANPWLIPRNWLAQQAIDAAEQGDLSVLSRLMRAIRNPYSDSTEFADLAAKRPDWARYAPGCSALSCSS